MGWGLTKRHGQVDNCSPPCEAEHLSQSAPGLIGLPSSWTQFMEQIRNVLGEFGWGGKKPQGERLRFLLIMASCSLSNEWEESEMWFL